MPSRSQASRVSFIKGKTVLWPQTQVLWSSLSVLPPKVSRSAGLLIGAVCSREMIVGPIPPAES